MSTPTADRRVNEVRSVNILKAQKCQPCNTTEVCPDGHHHHRERCLLNTMLQSNAILLLSVSNPWGKNAHSRDNKAPDHLVLHHACSRILGARA